MQIKDNKVFYQVVTIVAVVALTAAIGVGLSAQMGPGRSPMGGPGMGGPGGQGMRGGQGMMGGPGRMGGQRGMPGMMGGPLGMLGPGMRQLGITDEQRKLIREKVASHKSDFEGIANKMIEARTALNAAITAEPIDESAIRLAAQAVGAIEADAAVLRAKVHSEVFSLLTPEQQQKAKELRGKMEQRMKDRRDRMQDRQQQKRGGFELV